MRRSVGEDLLGRHRADAGKRVELLGRGGAQRDGRAAAPGVPPAAGARRRSGGAPRGDEDLLAVRERCGQIDRGAFGTARQPTRPRDEIGDPRRPAATGRGPGDAPRRRRRRRSAACDPPDAPAAAAGARGRRGATGSAAPAAGAPEETCRQATTATTIASTTIAASRRRPTVRWCVGTSTPCRDNRHVWVTALRRSCNSFSTGRAAAARAQRSDRSEPARRPG